MSEVPDFLNFKGAEIQSQGAQVVLRGQNALVAIT